MPRLLRPALMVTILLALAFPVMSGYAQDDESQPVVIQGSLQLESLMQAVRDEYLLRVPDAQIEIQAEGPSLGFDALCDGSADIVMATDPISDERITACSGAGQEFIETVIAYQVVALVASSDAQVICLSMDQITNLWSLSGVAEVTWTDLGAPTLTDPVTFYGPQDFAPIYSLFASLLPGGELREGINMVEDTAEITSLANTGGSNMVGFMSLSDFQRLNLESTLAAIAIQDANGDCVAPTVNTVENGTYPLANTAYLYVNAASAERADVSGFMGFVLGQTAGARTVAREQGFTVPAAATFETGLSNVQNGRTGRTFTRPNTPVLVSSTDVGTVTVVGSSMLVNLTRPITTQFNTDFPAVTVTANTLGNDQGWQAFCSGEADVLQATRAATDEEMALCEQNAINPYVIDLGYNGLVFAVPTGNDWVDCLTTEQVITLLRGGTDEAPAPANWNQVNPDWPDKTLLLVAPTLGTGETDYIITKLINDLTFTPRLDMAENDDPLYRVQGVANTAQDEANPNNALTYLWYSDMQRSQAQVKLLALDAGNGCVAPDPETLTDGSYALSHPVRYYFSQKAFSNGMARAFLWHFFDQTTVNTLRDHPFVGLDLEVYDTTLRDDVFALLEEYEQTLVAQPEVTATEAAPAGEGAEVVTTEEPAATEAAATEEVAPTEAATEEAAPTQAATEEPAPVVTEEVAPTEEVTPEATEAMATEEAAATPEPTEQATEAAE